VPEAERDDVLLGWTMMVAHGYSSSRAEQGSPVSLMRVRSLLVPPGTPDFLRRRRFLTRGTHEITGRAWSGRSAIACVDVSVDGGSTWAPADLDSADSPHAWQSWRWTWSVDAPGAYELCCRARDAAGNEQPLDPFWTARGMGNNAVQRVAASVL